MSRNLIDSLLLWMLRGAGVIAGSLAVLMVAFLALESLPALFDLKPTRFFTDASWHPLDNLYNLTPMLSASLFLMTGSVLLAAPLGILSAVFCRHYAPPPLARWYRRLIELLAGVPSVVYGLWGLVVLVPLIGRLRPPGQSLLAGILILALMILPTIALIADASLGSVPRQYLLGGSALGFTRWGLVWRIALPAARSGILAGIILGAGRAVGETMAVLMVSGNAVRMPTGAFDSVRALTANIALEMAYAMDTHRSALFVSGLILSGLIIALVAAADLAGRRRVLG